MEQGTEEQQSVGKKLHHVRPVLGPEKICRNHEKGDQHQIVIQPAFRFLIWIAFAVHKTSDYVQIQESRSFFFASNSSLLISPRA